MKHRINGNKIGNVINLMLDGNAYQKRFDNAEDANAFYKLMGEVKAGNENAYEELMKELNRMHKIVVKGILEKDTNENYYLKGYDIKMPELLADTFLDYLENDFPVEALVNFWKLLITNPDKEVIEDLFKFLQTYNFAITDKGYFIAYKSVEAKEGTGGDEGFDLAAFISNSYLKKKQHKKNPANYEVLTLLVEDEKENPAYIRYEEGDYEFDEEGLEDNGEDSYITVTTKELYLYDTHKGKYPDNVDKNHGNLLDLFKAIDSIPVESKTVYLSHHSDKNGNKVEQVLGRAVSMPRVDADANPKVECSTGYHVGSVKYVEKFGHTDNRDTRILLTLVSPAHVVAVPDYDNSKLRTCEYFPYAELEILEKDGDNRKFEVIESPYFEEDYMKYEITELEKELEKVRTELEQTNTPSIEQLDYKKILENRLITIEEALQEN